MTVFAKLITMVTRLAEEGEKPAKTHREDTPLEKSMPIVASVPAGYGTASVFLLNKFLYFCNFADPCDRMIGVKIVSAGERRRAVYDKARSSTIA